MLMNGVGLCGTLDGVNYFLQYIQTIVEGDWQVLLDSSDIRFLLDDSSSATNNTEGYLGETVFTMQYKKSISQPFPWVYIDFMQLYSMATFHNLSCSMLAEDESGRYLAKISSE